MIPQATIEAIRERLPISEVVAPYVALKKSGGSWKGLCPFHPEKSPSFMVSDIKRIYHCFGCGESGTIFNFVMKMEGVSFRDAVSKLAERAGVRIEEESTPQQMAEKVKRDAAYALNRAAADWFVSELKGARGARAREYLIQRKIPSESIERYRLGFGGESWDALTDHLRTKGHSVELAEQLGLLGRRDGGGRYNRFRNRLIFPILDVSERVVGFGGRSLDGHEPKYLNSSSSLIFDKSQQFYGISIAKSRLRDSSLLITEGYIDVITLHRYGFETAVATLGTALTDRHLRSVKGMGASVKLVFDSDAAGQNATQRALLLCLKHGVDASVVTLPRGDADSFLIAEGAERFSQLLDSAIPLTEFLAPRAVVALPAAERVKKLQGVMEAVREMTDPVAKTVMTAEFARRFQVDEKPLVAIAKIEKKAASVKRTTGEAGLAEEPFSFSKEEQLLLGLAIHHTAEFFESVSIDELTQFLSNPLQELFHTIAELQCRVESDRAPALLIETLDGHRAQSICSEILMTPIKYGVGIEAREVKSMIADATRAVKREWLSKQERALDQKLAEVGTGEITESVVELLKEKDRLIKSRTL